MPPREPDSGGYFPDESYEEGPEEEFPPADPDYGDGCEPDPVYEEGGAPPDPPGPPPKPLPPLIRQRNQPPTLS